MIPLTGTYNDLYQLTMAQVYFLRGKQSEQAVFDYFFRKLPFAGGYAVFAGLEDVLDVLENLHFSGGDIRYLEEQGLHPAFLEYLERFRFRGDIHSSREGDLVFPHRPVLRVEANIIEAQLIETLLLNILNFQTLVATKARRMRQVAGTGRKLVDFGLRRAHGYGGYLASRAAMIGGFDATSNVQAGRDYHIPVSGTMAHSFIESYDSELDAFRDFARERPDDCVLLVDTYETLKSGVPNAITVGKEMEKEGKRLKGIRLDSGDLTYLSIRARKMLDEAGLDYVKIAASNQLDEEVIKSILDEGASIDLFGVGTSLVTGQPDAALDGVYKLSMAYDKPRLKLSESLEKISFPHRKQVYRLLLNDHFYGGDVVALTDEELPLEMMHHPFDPLKSMPIDCYRLEPLLEPVMVTGRRVNEKHGVEEIRDYSQQRFNNLPEAFKRFKNPHVYKIGLSDRLHEERNRLIESKKKGDPT